ncbi:UDP-glycosyltransferase 86A1-like [Andrographis paniculata]|uniref:UDP-glycosyltransferase 86A1-like n=1 Tax=Andrographis paniculata TaxID=175694 RepID=UPI0021872241|nr:UDP-glycosyltransferase 86A1-like [Andrographis paniculata]QDA11330.1 UDP-glycosyltransferase [Andrographis paniculata]
MKAHALMISLPYQGHINPFLQLALNLASNGFSITFVHTHHAHHSISKSRRADRRRNRDREDDNVFAASRGAGLDINYATIYDGFPLEYDRNSNMLEFWEHLLYKFPEHVDEFVGKWISELSSSSENDVSPIPFLIADTFATWPRLIAKKYNLVNVSFWTQPALVFALSYHIDFFTRNGHSARSGDRDAVIDYIPGVEPMSAKDLMPHLQEPDESHIVHKIIAMAIDEVKKADFVLHNTVQELEEHALSVFGKLMPTYAIGPTNFFSMNNAFSNDLLSETDCTEWLNSKPPGSVLYVSFGSLVTIGKEVVRETAEGIRLSRVSFLWAIRPGATDDGETNALPAGFQDGVKDRGLIVPWCDQSAVLSHPAVGAFVTHCGWNSILESMWHGVPMICYPVLYDQPTNRKLVVDDWKVGINLAAGAGAAVVDGEDVAEKIKSVMCGEASHELRNNTLKFKKIVRNALAEDGSSKRNFDRFVKDLNEKLMKSKKIA